MTSEPEMNAVLKPSASPQASANPADHAIADATLAAWGRKEIRIAETEMPGLMAIRDEFGRASCRERVSECV